MPFEKFFILLSILALSLYHSTLGSFNYLWLVVIWLAVRQEWVMIFLAGLIFDLITGGTLGLSSMKFLIVTFFVCLIKEYGPLRSDKQLKLRI